MHQIRIGIKQAKIALGDKNRLVGFCFALKIKFLFRASDLHFRSTNQAAKVMGYNKKDFKQYLDLSVKFGYCRIETNKFGVKRIIANKLHDSFQYSYKTRRCEIAKLTLPQLRSLLCDVVVSNKINIIEDGTTFEENALIKARAVCKLTGQLTMADDSGLEIDYLNKEPGVYSARYMGHDTSYDIKNASLIKRLEGVEGQDRSGRFVCAIAVCFPDGKEIVKRGTMEGLISKEIVGDNGFGYDPIVYLPEYGKTSAQLDPEEKNKISHRGKALELIKKELDECL